MHGRHKAWDEWRTQRIPELQLGNFSGKTGKMSHNCRESVLIRHEVKIFIDRPDGDHYRGGPT
jgi:hypothetical protein